jgi:hypothetical protein
MNNSGWYKIIDHIPSEDDYDFRLLRNVKCTCKRDYVFLCQEDKEPEYYTFITMNCICGNLIKMKYPVG